MLQCDLVAPSNPGVQHSGMHTKISPKTQPDAAATKRVDEVQPEGRPLVYQKPCLRPCEKCKQSAERRVSLC